MYSKTDTSYNLYTLAAMLLISTVFFYADKMLFNGMLYDVVVSPINTHNILLAWLTLISMLLLQYGSVDDMRALHLQRNKLKGIIFRNFKKSRRVIRYINVVVALLTLMYVEPVAYYFSVQALVGDSLSSILSIFSIYVISYVFQREVRTIYISYKYINYLNQLG